MRPITIIVGNHLGVMVGDGDVDAVDEEEVRTGLRHLNDAR